MNRIYKNVKCNHKIFFILTLLIVLSLNTVHAETSVIVSPATGPAGSTVDLVGSGFLPGSYTGLILWDGVEADSFFIPIGGDFRVPFTLPTTALPGRHEIIVCAKEPTGGCTTADFEQLATTQVTVNRRTPTRRAAFNVQTQAIEVTQGVRTSIPTHTTARERVLLINDNWTHVANRRTVARVYPITDRRSAGEIPPVRAVMYGLNSGGLLNPREPLLPINGSLHLDPDKSLLEMRANTEDSWNFVIPQSWTQEGTIRLMVILNPAGPNHVSECPRCSDDNSFILKNVKFKPAQVRDIELRIYNTEMFWRDSLGIVQSLSPSRSDIANSIAYWIRTSPIDPDKIRFTWNNVSSTEHFGSIPGIPRGSVLSRIVDDANTDAIANYTFLPIIMSHRSHTSPPPIAPGDTVSYIPRGCLGAAAYAPVNYRTTTCGRVFAQESVHTMSISHACNTTPCPHRDEFGGPIDPSYPDNHGSVESNAFGFDVWNMLAIAPATLSGHTHDFMSYGGNSSNPYGPGRFLWVSKYTWDKQFNAFQNSPVTTGDEPPVSSSFRNVGRYQEMLNNAFIAPTFNEWLRISGKFDAQGLLQIDPSFLVSLPKHSNLTINDPKGTHMIQLLNSAEKVIFERSFTPAEQAHGSSGEFSFYQAIPIMKDTQTVLLKSQEKEVFRIQVSANAPEVKLAMPIADMQWSRSGKTNLSWIATDADQDSIYYRVEVSKNGNKWSTIASAVNSTNQIVDLSKLSVCGGKFQLRIQASDGIQVATDLISPIHIAPCTPQPLIVMPLDGEVFTYSKGLEFIGLADDSSSSDVFPQKLSWFIDDKFMGQGVSAHVPMLKPGKHIVRLQATNSDGRSGNMEVSITIDPQISKEKRKCETNQSKCGNNKLPMFLLKKSIAISNFNQIKKNSFLRNTTNVNSSLKRSERKTLAPSFRLF